MIKNVLYRWLLPELINKVCGSCIPRSGEEGAKLDCFIVALDYEESPYFVATGYEDGKLIGLKWNGERYSDAYTLTIENLSEGKLRITHYYGLSEVIYNSIYDVAWNHLSRLVYIKIHVYRYLSSVFQYLFNKQKLITKKRIELLHFMMNDQLDREHNGIRLIDLMTKLYSIKWILHPSAEEQQNKLELYLESLVESGELKLVNDEYVVTGKTISTIEKYEGEERRHMEAVKLQRKMVCLTFFIAFFALIQSGMIKLPVMLDMTVPKEHEAPNPYGTPTCQEPRKTD